MEQPHPDRRRYLSDHCCSQIIEGSGSGSGRSTELNRKRKLLRVCGHNESESPVSKQKLGSQQVTELAESSDNSVNSPPVISNVRDAAHPYMESDWYYTSSSCCSNEATSSSTFGSSVEFEGDANTDNVGSGGAQYGCKEELFKEIEALHDPVITALAKSSLGVSEHPDADTLDSMVCSNDLDDFGAQSAFGGAMQDGRAASRTLTIDQEFEQYFSRLML